MIPGVVASQDTRTASKTADEKEATPEGDSPVRVEEALMDEPQEPPMRGLAGEITASTDDGIVNVPAPRLPPGQQGEFLAGQQHGAEAAWAAQRLRQHAVAAMSGSTEPPYVLTAATGEFKLEGSGAELVISHRVEEAHQEMLRRIEVLESLLAGLTGHSAAGIGHNRPPEPIDAIPFNEDDRRAVANAIVVLKIQPVTPATPSLEAREAASTLKTIGERLQAYIGKQADVFISEAVKSAGSEFGKLIMRYVMLAGALLWAAWAASDWLHSLSP
jgi:hypothetical protein